MLKLTFEGKDRQDLEAQIQEWMAGDRATRATVAGETALVSSNTGEPADTNGATPPKPVKKKRKRRTKAEMEEARRLAAEAEAATMTGDAATAHEVTPEDRVEIPVESESSAALDHSLEPEKAHAQAVGLLKEVWDVDQTSHATVTELLHRYGVSTFLAVPIDQGHDLLKQSKIIAAEAGVVH